jgi:NADPH2:quinone reductase
VATPLRERLRTARYVNLLIYNVTSDSVRPLQDIIGACPRDGEGMPVQAIRVHKFGDPSAMVLEERPTPSPAGHEILARVAAAGVNFKDTQFRSGMYPGQVPVSLGTEGAGTVEAVGSDVTDFKPGDRVCWMYSTGHRPPDHGSYASHAIVPARNVVPLPAAVDFRQAAAVLFQGVTAHYLATSTYPLAAGDSCLVHSAAGGVGSLLCQIAKMRGATVIATVSTDAKAEVARQSGADHVINYAREDFAAEVKRLTGGLGVNVVYDAVGLQTFEKSFDSLKRRGLLALYGEASGVVPPLDPRLLTSKGSVFLTRTGAQHYIADRAEFLQRCQDVLGWVASGKLRVWIHHAYPLAEAPEAHRALEQRETIGKLLLIP